MSTLFVRSEQPGRTCPAAHEYWTNQNEARDFESAEHYLSLLVPAEKAHELVDRLSLAPIIYHDAINVLRVTGHAAYGESHPQVVREHDILTRAMYHARELAMNRMEVEAEEVGADGIVGVRLGEQT